MASHKVTSEVRARIARSMANARVFFQEPWLRAGGSISGARARAAEARVEQALVRHYEETGDVGLHECKCSLPFIADDLEPYAGASVTRYGRVSVAGARCSDCRAEDDEAAPLLTNPRVAIETYKMRAEMITDVCLFAQYLLGPKNAETPMIFKSVSLWFHGDCEVEFESALALDKLLEIIATVSDGHVMYETIQPAAAYTGTRTPRPRPTGAFLKQR